MFPRMMVRWIRSMFVAVHSCVRVFEATLIIFRIGPRCLFDKKDIVLVTELVSC